MDTRRSTYTSYSESDEYSTRCDRCKRNCVRCRRFTCNKAEGTCCGRTFRGWTQILFYYIFFILLVYVFFAIVLHFIGSRDTSGESKYRKNDLIYPAPGASLFPVGMDNTHNNILWLSYDDKKKGELYNQQISKFLSEMEEKCGDSRARPNQCSFNRTQLGPCGNSDFGYKAKKPCIYLKMNTLEEFSPKAFGDKNNIPEDVPEELKKKIDPNRKVVWVNCLGRSEYDQDHLGEINYHPEPAFNEDYFPMEVKRANPIVALELANIDPGYILRMRCKLYSKDLPDVPNFNENSFVYVE